MPALYRLLTDDFTKFIRVERLVRDAAAVVPGLVPDDETLARENALPQRDKDGAEIDQGLFLAHVLADEASGMHLCHAMLLPRPEAAELSSRFAERGKLEFEGATLERRGKAAFVTMRNPRFLNAEDEATLDGLETAVDVATLDRRATLRCCAATRSSTRNIAAAGCSRPESISPISITARSPTSGTSSATWGSSINCFAVWRGRTEAPTRLAGGTQEKPWIGVVDGFAIGGGCQLLLALDYVLAASDAYMTLPARKEGIIPGAANLRLWRFTGDRIARQAILYGRRLDCDTPEGRLVCDEIASPASIESALDAVIDGFTSSGVVSAAGNRRALRVGQEPLDVFRRYMAVYCREQAYCHFSPALIANLERNWNAHQRVI